ncbi:MAG: prephenate dehydrogenase/arogenate dehydrogenase family protein [Candidatus Omnitrophica bacterium]|nr:prephenate dehydrogenase/arogenate dehydrogenase family protein [Candidatus Omnitrophota bacterium]
MLTIHRNLFRQVTIVGVGLIGGSLGKAIKKHRLAREVIGVSQKQETLDAALKAGAIDQGILDIKKAVVNADLVILATPVSVIVGMLSVLGKSLKRNCIVTDVGSTKASVVNVARDHFPSHVHFIGSHPLAGSEKSGVDYSREDLFENTLCIMTPTQATHRFALERVKALWTKVGAKVETLSPEEHDKALAFVSHLPHLLAYALMEAIPTDLTKYAGQGLKDTTRIAGSSPQMWGDICLGNSRNIVNALDEMTRNLSLLRKAVHNEDSKSLLNYFKSAKDKKEKLS